MESTCKITAAILLILAFVVGIVLASESSSFLPFVYCLAGGFPSFLLFYALGKIFERLDAQDALLVQMHQAPAAPELHEKIPDSEYKPPVVKREPGDWTCPQCGAQNKPTELFCKDCGTYR
ncbi:MAG: hypothetical protein PHD32_10945 [Eubacteriales bacterium]|nr:hypothetical protein [Eubacteriales bacterium]